MPPPTFASLVCVRLTPSPLSSDFYPSDPQEISIFFYTPLLVANLLTLPKCFSCLLLSAPVIVCTSPCACLCPYPF